MKINFTLKKLIACMMGIMLLLCLALPSDVVAATYNARISLEQVFTETDVPAGKVIKYVLKPANGAPIDGFAVSGTGVIGAGINASGEYEFTMDGSVTGELVYTGLNHGIYEYTLECVPDDRTELRYIFDSVKYDVNIFAESGAPDAAVVIKDINGNKPASAKFTHSYGDADPFIVIDPPVRKRVEGNPAEDAEFRFRLRAVDNDAGYAVNEMPMPEGSVNGEKYLTVIGAGEEEFGWWTYTKAGTYTYDISEVDMGDEDYKYDTKMFTLTDVVTRQNNQLSVTRTIIDSNGVVVQNTLIRSSREATTVKLDYVNEYVGNNLGPGGDDGDAGDDGGNDNGDDSGGNTGGSDDNGGSGGKVRTGDIYRPILWIALWAIASIGTILMLMLYRHK